MTGNLEKLTKKRRGSRRAAGDVSQSPERRRISRASEGFGGGSRGPNRLEPEGIQAEQEARHGATDKRPAGQVAAAQDEPPLGPPPRHPSRRSRFPPWAPAGPAAAALLQTASHRRAAQETHPLLVSQVLNAIVGNSDFIFTYTTRNMLPENCIFFQLTGQYTVDKVQDDPLKNKTPPMIDVRSHEFDKTMETFKDEIAKATQYCAYKALHGLMDTIAIVS
ncbi:hypothetical protein GUJ93_ZPchr0007g4443 [Zizania palustris]|uniref:Uncharacterized protein n=1 Tax=Zizania palustris TaxID=103762 RepID=A0A8J5VPC2_ZIZPA|nr:hypothetical protein GUJ93_ZPchr0007g4443 [Zizania palustris]KAG8079787.1 hypothetical protein GUJ93_ZPchr0007g4443 [Zizania palustris]